MIERSKTVMNDLVAAIRNVMLKHEITNEELRFAVKYLKETANTEFELELMMENFFEITTAHVTNNKNSGSASNIAGPFFLEDAPDIGSEGEIKTLEEGEHLPIVIRGQIKDLAGKPISGVKLDVWHSTPRGTYSGVHEGIPSEYYRAKLTTDEMGYYKVRTTKPVPYQIPDNGNTGRLLKSMGRHAWRPAHVHFKAHKPGLQEHITQVYFNGEDYVDSDCCEAVIDELVIPFVEENGEQVIIKNFVLDAA